MFKDKSVPDGGAYTIDFSPVNQTSPMTLVKMLLGQSVLGTNTSTVCNYYLETDFYIFFVIKFSSTMERRSSYKIYSRLESLS